MFFVYIFLMCMLFYQSTCLTELTSSKLNKFSTNSKSLKVLMIRYRTPTTKVSWKLKLSVSQVQIGEYPRPKENGGRGGRAPVHNFVQLGGLHGHDECAPQPHRHQSLNFMFLCVKKVFVQRKIFQPVFCCSSFKF